MQLRGSSSDSLDSHMKAVRYTEYGSSDTLRLVDVDRPVPKGDEVLIRVYAASVNALDLHFMHGRPRSMRLMTGLRRPKEKRVGVDVAGQVESVGANVTQFKPGDNVFGVARGAFAEYTCALESKIAMKPTRTSFEKAAAVPIAAVTALQGIRDTGRIQPGEKVLINGAGGGVGTFAVQLAKDAGAEVTAVTKTKNMEMVRAIGAHHVIDYTRDDFTKNGLRYDAIFDLGATHRLSDIRRALTKEGRWLIVGGANEAQWFRLIGDLLKAIAQAPFVSQKVKVVPARARKEQLTVLQELLEAGRITPFIDRTYPLSDVAEAMRYLEGGQVAGKVVVTVEAISSARPPFA